MSTLKLRRLVVGAALPLAAAASLTAVSATTASAKDPTERTLQQLCESRDGYYYITPFDIARCQAARPRAHRDDPLAAERHVCAELGGTIRVGPSNRPQRVTWVCG